MSFVYIFIFAPSSRNYQYFAHLACVVEWLPHTNLWPKLIRPNIKSLITFSWNCHNVKSHWDPKWAIYMTGIKSYLFHFILPPTKPPKHHWWNCLISSAWASQTQTPHKRHCCCLITTHALFYIHILSVVYCRVLWLWEFAQLLCDTLLLIMVWVLVGGGWPHLCLCIHRTWLALFCTSVLCPVQSGTVGTIHSRPSSSTMWTNPLDHSQLLNKLCSSHRLCTGSGCSQRGLDYHFEALSLRFFRSFFCNQETEVTAGGRVF